jgi:hypothetical protein
MAETDEQTRVAEPAKTGEPARERAPRRGAAAPWLAGLALLCVIGIGLYLAWPHIAGRDGAPVAPARLATSEPAPSEPPPAQPTEPVPPTEAVPAEPPAPPGEPDASSVIAELKATRERVAALERTVAGPPAAETDAAAKQLISELTARLEALEARAVATSDPQSVEREAALGARLSVIESKLDAAQSALAEAAELRVHLAESKAQAETLAARLGALEARSTEDVRLIALVAARGALAQAARDGLPLAHQLSDLRALLGDAAPVSPALATLDSFATQGALTLEALRQRFPEVARTVARAANEPKADAGWVDQTVARLKSIVTVRKIGGALEPGSIDERLVRAEHALGENDATGAATALDGLQGGTMIDEFRTGLARRIALDEAVKAIERHVADLVAGRFVPSATSAQ